MEYSINNLSVNIREYACISNKKLKRMMFNINLSNKWSFYELLFRVISFANTVGTEIIVRLGHF